MFSEIILNTILVPLVLGVFLFFVAQKLPGFDRWGALITGIALFGIFVLLEGWPSLPPISSKPKVAVLIAVFTVLNAGAVFLRLNRIALFVVLLGSGLLWIGWNRVGDMEMLPRFAALSVPILIGGWMFHKFEQQDQTGLFWPITLIAFAIGGAVIALMGAYIGLAQVIGAMAAFLGGFALVSYIFIVFRPNTSPIILPQSVYQIILLCMMAVFIAIGLFAPEISTSAIVILSLGMLIPMLAARFAHFPAAVQPLIYGIVVAIPTGAAIAVAAL